MSSYRRYDAGAPHRLVLLCKGFPDERSVAPVLERLGGLKAERIDVPDDGFDLTAYSRAAARLGEATACFLNSSSVLLADGWLELLVSALEGHPAVGIAGATGSWNSLHSSVCYDLHLPSAYTTVFRDRSWYARQLRDAAAAGPAKDERDPLPRQLRTAYRMARGLVLFRPFPAVHVRTNAFAVRTEVMRRVRFRPLRNKERAWRLESGRASITDQVAAMGMRAVVVGRNGRSYDRREWAASDTLWQAGQENLLVADNQTELYRAGDLDLRRLLSALAWGPQARPTEPD